MKNLAAQFSELFFLKVIMRGGRHLVRTQSVHIAVCSQKRSVYVVTIFPAERAPDRVKTPREHETVTADLTVTHRSMIRAIRRIVHALDSAGKTRASDHHFLHSQIPSGFALLQYGDQNGLVFCHIILIYIFAWGRG